MRRNASRARYLDYPRHCLVQRLVSVEAAERSSPSLATSAKAFASVPPAANSASDAARSVGMTERSGQCARRQHRRLVSGAYRFTPPAMAVAVSAGTPSPTNRAPTHSAAVKKTVLQRPLPRAHISRSRTGRVSGAAGTPPRGRARTRERGAASGRAGSWVADGRQGVLLRQAPLRFPGLARVRDSHRHAGRRGGDRCASLRSLSGHPVRHAGPRLDRAARRRAVLAGLRDSGR